MFLPGTFTSSREDLEKTKEWNFLLCNLIGKKLAIKMYLYSLFTHSIINFKRQHTKKCEGHLNTHLRTRWGWNMENFFRRVSIFTPANVHKKKVHESTRLNVISYYILRRAGSIDDDWTKKLLFEHSVIKCYYRLVFEYELFTEGGGFGNCIWRSCNCGCMKILLNFSHEILLEIRSSGMLWEVRHNSVILYEFEIFYVWNIIWFLIRDASRALIWAFTM